MRDYAKPAGYPEIEFIQNLFVKSTAELSERWYGGIPLLPHDHRPLRPGRETWAWAVTWARSVSNCGGSW
jgi:hypothetical protein